MILYQEPLIAQIPSNIDSDFLDQLLGIDDFTPSQGWSHQTGSSAPVRQRTSLSYYDYNDGLFLVRKMMLDRISAELDRHHPLGNCEYLQLTRYCQNQQYEPHYDNFNLTGYENTVKIDRCATALLYLNDGFLGGNTDFPLLNISVVPKQGDILYFEYPPGLDHLTLHAGQPVLKGEKRIISLWIRSGPWQIQD